MEDLPQKKRKKYLKTCLKQPGFNCDSKCWCWSSFWPPTDLKIMVTYRFPSSGEIHLDPARPRPLVISSASTTVPWGAPSASSRLARSMVVGATKRYTSDLQSSSVSSCFWNLEMLKGIEEAQSASTNRTRRKDVKAFCMPIFIQDHGQCGKSEWKVAWLQVQDRRSIGKAAMSAILKS